VGREDQRMRGWIVGTCLIAAVLGGCSRSDTPEAIAERFVQAYYVQIDQAAAVEFTAALARHRLQEELQTVAQIRRGSAVAQARPKIEYHLTRTQVDGRQRLFVYDLTITPLLVPPIAKKVLIITEQFGEGWKVINFTEADSSR
jgi:hypothetical protein